MWIHKAELKHVRSIKDVNLDLSKPLTIIGGRNGTGKTAVQDAILAAMFERDKKDRDSLISDHDPHSPPEATVWLSRGEPEPAIRLWRELTSKNGEWNEGDTTIKAKGKALEKIQESLPICADAAATLLWSRQEQMAAIVDDFPDDAHKLLTAATVKGSGPDPKQVIEELDKQFKDAKRGGKKNPGSLSQASQKVADYENELEKAQEAQKSLETLKTQYEQAKLDRDQFGKLRRTSEKKVRHLECLERLLDAALKADTNRSKLEETEDKWNGLDNEIDKARRAAKDFEEELGRLQSQYRVARDGELADQIGRLNSQIGLVTRADEKRRQLQEQLDVKERPDESDLEEFRKLNERRTKTTAEMEATGLRYGLSVQDGTKTVQVSEENRAFRDVTLNAGQTHEATVGSVHVRVGELQMAASGKKDIAGLQQLIEETKKEIGSLLCRFGVDDEEGFRALKKQRAEIESALAAAQAELKQELQGATLGSLKANLELLEKTRNVNNMTQEDKERLGGTTLLSASEIKEKIARKETEVEGAQAAVKQLEEQRPTEAEKEKLQSTLRDARRKAREAHDAFIDEDDEQREPTEELRNQIRSELPNERQTLTSYIQKHSVNENEVTRLFTELKHAGPERPVDTVTADLEEARAILGREEVFQSAREKLKDRIATKISEMSENIPRELGASIGEHIAELTGGAYAKVSLNEKLEVASVSEGGQLPVAWKPDKLSTGERAIIALTVKVAVAQALAKLGTPVFVMLDDSLVALDPEYRAATEELLFKLVGNGNLQVILITCHTDWALDWKEKCPDKVHYIDFAKEAVYYREPAALLQA